MERIRKRSRFARARALILALLFGVFAVGGSPSALAREAYVITVQNTAPENLVGAIRPLLGEGDDVTAYGHELIVTTSPDRIDNVRQLVAQLDTRLRNLLIAVDGSGTDSTRQRERGFSGGIRRDNTYLGTGGPIEVPDSGALITHDGLAYSISDTERTRTSLSSQQLRAVEGSPAFLYTGQTLQWIGEDDEGNPTTDTVDALRGFYVTARLFGDRVQLTLSTRDDRLSNESRDGQLLIDTQQLSTTVSGRVGEWIDLGGVVLSERDDGRNTVKKTTGQRARVGNLRVKITPAD